MTFKKIFDVNTLKQKDFKTWSHDILLGIILFYAFSRFIGPDANKLAQGGLGIFLIYLLVKNPDQIRRDPMCLLFVAVVVSQVATWVSVEIFHPELPDNALKIDRLGKLFLFIPIAWGLQQRQKWVPIVLLTACLGFIADLFWGCNFFSQLTLALGGQRVDFGVRNAQHTSMLFGLMVIVSAFYLVVANKKTTTGMALLFFVIGLAGMTATQTRQTFLGIIVASIVVFIVSCFVIKFSLKKVVVSLVTIGVLLGTSSYSINNRENDVWDTIKVLTEPLPETLKTAGENDVLAYYIGKLENTSSGLRVKMWIAMLPYMYQNPFLGWGSTSIKDKIHNNPLLENVPVQEFGHLHNYHITLYICYGLIGVLLINGVYVWLLVSGFRLRKKFPRGEEWFLLSVGFVFYWMIINCFENFNGFWTGVFCHNLILGCIYTHYLAHKKTNDFVQSN